MSNTSKNFSLDVGNNTNGVKSLFQLHVVDIYLGFSIFAAIFCNGLILFVYIKMVSLRTSFYAYIANLCAAELLNAGGSMTLAFARLHLGYWPLNYAACAVSLYCGTIFGSGMRYSHLLVAANRLWAVTFPAHFRRYSHMLTSVCIITGSWVFVHMLNLPVLIPSYVRPGVWNHQCTLNTSFQKKTAVFATVMSYLAPEVAMVVFGVVTWYKVYKRRKIGIMRQRQLLMKGRAAAFALHGNSNLLYLHCRAFRGALL